MMAGDSVCGLSHLRSLMSINTVREELVSQPGYDHVTFSVDGGDNYVVLLDNGSVAGAYAVNDKFSLSQRAGFSLDPHISSASIDTNALKIELASHPGQVSEWLDSYTVSMIADLTQIDENAIHVTRTNEPPSDDELAVKIDPVDMDTLFSSVYNELENRAEAKKALGFTDEELDDIGVQSVDDDLRPQTDAENFVSLAAGQKLSINDTLAFSNGFYVSEILNTIVRLAEDEKITLARLDANGEYTETVIIGAMRPEQTDPSINSLAYLDAAREDGQDAHSAEDLYRDGEGITETEESQTADDQPAAEAETNLVVPDLPSFNMSAVDHADEGEEENADEEEPITADDLAAEVLDPSLPEDVADEVEEAAGDAEREDEATETGADIDLETVDSLVNAVSKAREALQALKGQKAAVDSRLAGLPIEEEEEVSKQIASLKEDRAEIDEKIEQLRAQKAQIDSEIADARDRKAQIEEELSHKDELEAESRDLKAKIASLTEVL